MFLHIRLARFALRDLFALIVSVGKKKKPLEYTIPKPVTGRGNWIIQRLIRPISGLGMKSFSSISGIGIEALYLKGRKEWQSFDKNKRSSSVQRYMSVYTDVCISSSFKMKITVGIYLKKIRVVSG